MAPAGAGVTAGAAVVVGVGDVVGVAVGEVVGVGGRGTAVVVGVGGVVAAVLAATWAARCVELTLSLRIVPDQLLRAVVALEQPHGHPRRHPQPTGRDDDLLALFRALLGCVHVLEVAVELVTVRRGIGAGASG